MNGKAAGGMLDRRRFLGALPGAVVVAGGLPGLGRFEARAEGWPVGNVGHPGSDDGAPALQVPSAIGVQLYTVRSVMTGDPDGTLAAIAAIGYEEVELAGLYGMSAREMKARLDAVGLAATSSHHSVEEVRGSWEAILDAAVALGQSLVVVPALPAAERDGEALRRVADDFNRAGEAARAAGLRFGYHNHDWEMHPDADGVRPIDLLLDRTDPELVDWQMDIFWVVHAGADPMAELDARAGRVTSFHVKDRTAAGDMADVGAGVIDFRPVLARAGELGLLHQYVEHDQPRDPIESVRASYRALRDIVPSGAEDRSA
ncbi:MAG: sugar phosphate isomerase/epimerase [Gammaproteobacteria bacterium]|nr:sugar phosphate isomerase/epimerase [Gammaproteobacteria bacterium]MYI22599.1 sugar phosphate isomerase/epimerase [Gammaproteobacteria bacterium]